MKPNNIILDKSKLFALSIIELYKYLYTEKKEFVISKQILSSATSIGANAKEASLSQSKRDYIAELSISLKKLGRPNIGLNYYMTASLLTRRNIISYTIRIQKNNYKHLKNSQKQSLNNNLSPI